jgi:NADH:ubiquinone oxidoreductase subunit F (NADH-binding)/(2Fe-2S) ferredoxin/NAD-dependent dihydropyrimidine dehydrogenase PreA subunit
MAKVSTALKREGFRIRSAAELASYRESILAGDDTGQAIVIVCHGTGCVANGSVKVATALKKGIAAAGLEARVVPRIKTTGCHGFCSRGPLVILEPAGLFYQRVQPEDCEDIIETTLIKGDPVTRLLYHDLQTEEPIPFYRDIPFYQHQQRIILRHIGKIDPTDIRDTIAAGGYQALVQAITSMKPEEIIHAVQASGLRGRGGGGFPTGFKWSRARDSALINPGPVYVVGNGDEGDPGAFMDRTLMEGDPHAVLEGMIIGAFALGASQGFIYVRQEYPLAVRHLRIAIEQDRALGLLGQDILGTGFDFDIQIIRGAGAFVCGEETALLASIAGRAGEPITRPPYPAEEGLWGRPTIINNVETWANVPHIIEKGAEWFANLGVPHSTGTKIFSLVGKVHNTGLVEVPMGITLGDIVEKIGGGVPGQQKFKAVQTGGPSGGLIPYELKGLPPEELQPGRLGLKSRGGLPVELKNLPVDYDSLLQAGSIMGSGGMIVMDDHDCVVDLARYFLRFLQDESCGKCLPCRLGLNGMLEFLDGFAKGQGTPQDIGELESLAQAIVDGSLCGLGGTAPNPVLTSIRYFRDEYLAHIVDHKCPAGVCRDLITYRIEADLCNGCTLCAKTCPQACIAGENKKPHTINQDACIRCGACMDVCPVDAVVVD